jgi:phosphotransferase system enzyme I (PtsI)
VSKTLTGRAAAPGAAVGPAFTVHSPVVSAESLPETRAGSVQQENERLHDALARAEAELRELAERVAAAAGDDEAEIFEAHADFATDPELVAQTHTAIQSGASAERAVIQAFDTFRQLLAASTNEYLAARAADLDDVRDRVVSILRGYPTGVPVPAERSVIVARSLTPSQTASLPRELIAAIVTETGSPTSHAAILARALGTAAVVGCEGLLAEVHDGMRVAVDGRRGAITVSPSEDELHTIEERIREEEKRQAELSALREEKGRTADGHRVELAANIGSPRDLPAAIEAGAEGSGLVRTEFLFVDRRTAPSVDEQTRFYVEVLEAFPSHRVVFRTMDIGADKPLPFVSREPEENPALGLRGIRLSLERQELLRDQLRALLLAKQAVGEEGRMAIMFPMVASVGEFEQASEILREVGADEGVELAGIEIGVTVEVPSAAVSARRIAARADFLSIGTNDLLQYLFAADRLNAFVSDLPDICEPDVLALIGDVVEAGHAEGSWVGVCGEAANDPTVAAALVGLGADELSMTRVAIPEVKDTLRSLNLDDCRHAVRTAIAEAADGAEARRLLEEKLGLPR